MPNNHQCRGCGRNIGLWRTWCQWCKPVHLNGSTVGAMGVEDGQIMITLIEGSKPRVVYIDPGRSCLLAQMSIAHGFCPGLADELKLPSSLQLGPNAQGWSCNDCGQTFVWHRGSSEKTEPTECPLCGSADIHKAEVIEEGA